MLVGRDREIETLREAIGRAEQGERALLVVTGEPGIGKTRLLEELAAAMVRAGGMAVWGRTWEVGLTPAFLPWIQILAGLEVEGDRAPQLTTLEADGGRADMSARFARFGEVVAFLVRRATARPLALVFDDVHAADPSSLQLLEYVAPLLLHSRIVLALAARDADASPENAAALGRIQRGAIRMPLARLGRQHVDEIVGKRADSGRVFELSEGNPLFVEELVASVATDGELRLPQLSSVRAVIRERVARLHKPTVEALVAAAVIGRDFTGAVVADMIDSEDVGPALQPVLRLGMATATSPDRYRFSHALIAEAIASEVDPSERARLHLRAARALQKRASEPSLLAHHLLSAGALAGMDAVDAAEHAARAAFGQLAFEAAAALLARAEHALELISPDDDARRATLLCARAEALQQAAQHDRAATMCDQAAALARKLGDGSLLARIALARGLELRFGLTDPVLVDALREALAMTSDIAVRARLLARLAAAEQPATDPMEPVARAMEAIELAKQLSSRDRLDVMYVATAALVDYLPPDAIDPIHHVVLELARGTDRWITVHTRLRMCFSTLERVDRRGFDIAVDVFAQEARALGLPRWTRLIYMLEAMTALIDGRFADATRAVDEAQAITATLGDAGGLWRTDVHRVIAQWIATAPVDREVADRVSNYPRARSTLLAWFATQRGDRDAARAALAQAQPPADLDLFGMFAAAVAFAGEPAQVETAYQYFLPRRGGVIVSSLIGFAVVDLCDRLLLILATAAREWDAVDEHAESALATAARLGSPPWTARIRADWADALAARGDTARASELRAHALADAQRLGMPGLIARCAGAARVAAKPASAHANLTITREGELWLVSAYGEQLHVKDSRGMQMIARLVSEPGRDVHVLDLAGSGDAVDGGDAGVVLDAKARAEYRARLGELVAERDQAESWGDPGRAERAGAEIEALTAELSRAVGRGGRERKVGAASERARSNVQRRITHAIEQIRSASPRIAEHLQAAISTGTYCTYAPAGWGTIDA